MFKNEKLIKRTNSAEDACQAAWGYPSVSKAAGEQVQVLQRDIAEVNSVVGEEIEKFLQVPDIGVQCVRTI